MNKAAKVTSLSANDSATRDHRLEIAPSLSTPAISKKALKALIVLLSGGRPDSLLRSEEELISALADNYGEDFVLHRREVSDLAHINEDLCSGTYDIIHFSGERHSDDRHAETSFVHQHLTALAGDRTFHPLESAPRPPKLLVFISCFSRQPADLFLRCAPFVIRTDPSVGDRERAAFVEAFYTYLFATRSVTSSFEHATRRLGAEGLHATAFTLQRPELTQKGRHLYLKCVAPAHGDGILINMDRVAGTVDALGITREEVLHLMAGRMPLDHRLLNVSRDDALIPIGDVLLGSFSWKKRGEVACTKIARLGSVPEEQLTLWRTFLKSYNLLAASKYRELQRPADPAFELELGAAVAAFESSIENALLGSSDRLVGLGFRRLLPYLARAESECAEASDRLLHGDYRGVVLALERALTLYHAVVSSIQPPVT